MIPTVDENALAYSGTKGRDFELISRWRRR
jgi:hypothetical protein